MADEPISLPEIASRNNVAVWAPAQTAAGDDLVITSLQIGQYFTERPGIPEQRQC